MTKRIQYDRQSKDFAAYLNEELIGYFGSYHAAEVEIDRLVFEALTHGGA